DELRDCDDDELDVRLTNARKELFNLRFQAATGRLDNVARIGQLRKDVARVLTVQRDREIAAAESGEPGAAATAGRVTESTEEN
ncbi:MAG TPA: 50S ribosomal protein L29, partial [Acidimicrobiales bacterium]|nr:50S ribosomal protein L29 [Acidimicrobiales bacterium]